MMNIEPYIIEILDIVVLLFLSPLFMGWIRTLKCWLQSRTSPGLFQPYRDILKLFSKEIILAENASWIFRLAPYLIFGVTLLIGGIVPILSVNVPLSATADVIVLVALFGLSRFFTALAGLDIGTAFGGMGSSREMLIASLAEPGMLMTIFVASLVNHSTSLSQIVQTMIQEGLVLRPSLAFAFLSFTMITLAETGRVPVDNPVTHLELTMIHEGMILEYSGRYLALIEWAGMMKFLLFVTIGITIFFPWGIAFDGGIYSIAESLILLILKLLVVGAGIVFIEIGLAKMRIFRVPEYLGTSFLFATLGMLSYFILGL